MKGGLRVRSPRGHASGAEPHDALDEWQHICRMMMRAFNVSHQGKTCTQAVLCCHTPQAINTLRHHTRQSRIDCVRVVNTPAEHTETSSWFCAHQPQKRKPLGRRQPIIYRFPVRMAFFRCCTQRERERNDFASSHVTDAQCVRLSSAAADAAPHHPAPSCGCRRQRERSFRGRQPHQERTKLSGGPFICHRSSVAALLVPPVLHIIKLLTLSSGLLSRPSNAAASSCGGFSPVLII